MQANGHALKQVRGINRQGSISRPAAPSPASCGVVCPARSAPAAARQSSAAAVTSHPAHPTALKGVRHLEKQKPSAPTPSACSQQPLQGTGRLLSTAQKPVRPKLPKCNPHPVPSSKAQEVPPSNQAMAATNPHPRRSTAMQEAEAVGKSHGGGSGALGQLNGTGGMVEDGRGPDAAFSTSSSLQLRQTDLMVAQDVPPVMCPVDKTSVVQWWLSVSASPRDSALP